MAACIEVITNCAACVRACACASSLSLSLEAEAATQNSCIRESIRQHTSAYVCGETEAEAATQRVYLPQTDRYRDRDKERD